MARPSIALFLVTAGLMAVTVGCSRAPEPKRSEGGESGVSTPTPAQPPSAPAREEGGEGGEG
jgi:hypothetical protein